MKIISSALQDHVAGAALTLATCWRVQRLDGTVYTFTDHDRDLVVAGETYLAESGFTRSAIEGDSTLAAPNLQVIGFVDVLNEQDLRNGLWDYAECTLFLVNWASPGDGEIKLRKGWLGEVIVDDSGEYQAELRGLAEVIGNKVGELYSPQCRAQLGDSRCRVNLADFTFTGNAGTGSTRTIFHNTGLTNPSGYLDGGIVTITGGANDGVRREIISWDGSLLTLFLPLPHDIAVGDTFNAVPGCNKTTSDCINKFNNILNMRAEPFIPGANALMAYAIPGQTPP